MSLPPVFRAFTSLLTVLILALVISCKPGEKPAATAAETNAIPNDLAGFTIEDIPGSEMKYARKINAGGNVEIEGFLLNNKKTGQWIQYGAEGDIGLINNYVEGELEGAAMRMTYRNQVDLKTNYRKGVLHGPWVSYKFGKKIEERNYNLGRLDGPVRTYDDRTFKLKQEAFYKNGKQDGLWRYFDENGNVTVEYEYKDGIRISGGMKEGEPE